jgi:hypothetical protein
MINTGVHALPLQTLTHYESTTRGVERREQWWITHAPLYGPSSAFPSTFIAVPPVHPSLTTLPCISPLDFASVVK